MNHVNILILFDLSIIFNIFNDLFLKNWTMTAITIRNAQLQPVVAKKTQTIKQWSLASLCILIDVFFGKFWCWKYLEI